MLDQPKSKKTAGKRDKFVSLAEKEPEMRSEPASGAKDSIEFEL
jgi:hypothetical protein